MTASNHGKADLKREKDVDKMWSTIDPLMHRRYEEAVERRNGAS